MSNWTGRIVEILPSIRKLESHAGWYRYIGEHVAVESDWGQERIRVRLSLNCYGELQKKYFKLINECNVKFYKNNKFK